MSTVPYRGIAKGGVITDMSPYTLPLGSWSWGQNVRFRNQDITRAPVFRTAQTSLAYSSPRFLSAINPASGFDSLLIGYLNGRVTSLASGTETDVSVSGYTNSNAEGVYTSCQLGDVEYVNRPDRAPWSLLPTGSIFTTLPNWAPVSSPWTCNILRASNNALVALGVTKNGTSFPTTVITSEFALAGAVPTTWDYTVGTNNATENVLGEMQGPITDACPLGNLLMIYGQNETWVMFLSGDANIWDNEPVFGDVGAISANCVVEVDKKHYVFGLNDIWAHDGNSKESICDERTREFIFNGLSVTNVNRCSVAYNKNLKEIYFRYVSSDQYCSFLGTGSGCNRQATFHIPTNTWSFDDLPFVYGAVMANLNNSRTYATDTFTYLTAPGTYASLNNTLAKVMTMVGDVSSTYGLVESVYAFDLQGPGAVTAFPVSTAATMGWTLIRNGIDLDELKADLVGYKVINSIIPQGTLEPGASPIQFSFGSSDYFNEAVAMSPVQTYDGAGLYKLDYNAAGRYLSMTIYHPDYHYISLSGFDLDLGLLGEF